MVLAADAESIFIQPVVGGGVALLRCISAIEAVKKAKDNEG